MIKDTNHLTYFDVTLSWDIFTAIFDQKVTEIIHDDCHWAQTKTELNMFLKKTNLLII